MVNELVPFSVDQMFSVKPFENSSQIGGRFEVVAASKIVISQSGGIDASFCGLTNDSKYEYESWLKHGGFVAKSLFEGVSCRDVNAGRDLNAEYGSGGGIISLCAGGNMVNKGALLSRASEDGLFSGGTIFIFTDGVFVNRGIIDGGDGGTIQIHCARFVNHGEITPTPEIVITASDLVSTWFKTVNAKRGKDVVRMRVHDHKGHYTIFGPENVLKRGTKKMYVGDYGDGDWITFSHKETENTPMIPINIGIRNDEDQSALKAISIHGSRDGVDFEPWICIGDIQKGHDELQIFDVDPASGYFAWKRGFAYYRVNVLRNYGAGYCSFYEFRVYGISG